MARACKVYGAGDGYLAVVLVYHHAKGYRQHKFTTRSAANACYLAYVRAGYIPMPTA